MSLDNSLRWQCRRGMLEIDILLNGFIDNGYNEISDGLKDDFQKLLKTPDNELLEWLMLRKTPENGHFEEIIQHIRAATT